MAGALPEIVSLLARAETDGVEVHALGGGRAAIFSAASPRHPSDNEDAVALLRVAGARAVLALADGLGGHCSGAAAAERALVGLSDALTEAAGGDAPLRSAIIDGFERANAQVLALGSGAATTMAAVEVDGPAIRPYHVGDSMILVLGQRGRLRLATVSHSPVGYGVEAGLLDARSAIHHEDRHLVSNVVGTADMRIDLGPQVRLRPRDTVLLASDGLFDNLHLEEIVEHVRKGDLADATTALVAHARRRMEDPQPGQPSHPDDLSAIVYRPR
jgi:serine/threonine protein phosphatase PrpC